MRHSFWGGSSCANLTREVSLDQLAELLFEVYARHVLNNSVGVVWTKLRAFMVYCLVVCSYRLGCLSWLKLLTQDCEVGYWSTSSILNGEQDFDVSAIEAGQEN